MYSYETFNSPFKASEYIVPFEVTNEVMVENPKIIVH